MTAPHTPPILPGFDHFPVGPGLPVLLVYGERAFAAAHGPTAELHWYTKVALPERVDPEDQPFIAEALVKLQDRAVVIWPMRGDEGRARAKRDAALVAGSGASAVGIAAAADIDLSQKLPPGAPKFVLRDPADAALAAAKARTLPRLANCPSRAVPPWMDDVALTEVLAETCSLLRRYLAEGDLAIDTIALWCLHAWAVRSDRGVFDVSPRLVLRALDARADHARALRLIAWLTPAPLIVSRTIASHVLDALDGDQPTLLFDDVAGGTLYRRDMCALIAAGAYRDGIALTQRTRKNPAGRSQCFAPTAVATTALLPEDIRLRSIVVPMAPTPMGDSRARLTLREPPPDVLALRGKMQSVAVLITDDASAFAMLPRSLATSTRENWSPLMTIALRVGAETAKRTAEAAMLFTANAPPAVSNLALLRDIRDLGIVGAEDRIASADLLAKLTADPESTWATARQGRALSSRGLAERLANFGIRPSVMRTDDGVLARGYRSAPFVDAFARYLGDITSDMDTLEASDA